MKIKKHKIYRWFTIKDIFIESDVNIISKELRRVADLAEKEANKKDGL